MSAELAAATFVFVTTLSPGPNNLIVMHAAARGGARAALPAMFGIVLGGLVMLVVLQFGLHQWMQANPARQRMLQITGATLLIWIAWGLATEPAPANEQPPSKGRKGLFGMLLFQCLNPKTWLGTATAISLMNHRPNHHHNLSVLLLLYTLIPLINLSVWAGLGGSLTRRLQHPPFRRGFYVGSGLLLLAFALRMLR